MKKIQVWLAAVVALIVGVCCLAACGSVTGTYKFDSMTYTENGVTTTLKVGETYMGMISLSEDFATLELKADGTCEMKVAMIETTVSGTWKQDEADSNKIIVTAEGEEQTFVKSGNTLSFENEGVTIVLKK